MINRIINFSVYHSGIVLALTFVVAIVGWMGFQTLPIDAVPDITNVQVQINTPVDGLVPEEIERNITFPIETVMNGVPGVMQVRSITRIGLSQVTVVFEDSMDIYRARQQVNERLQAVISQLPPNAHPVLGPISTGLGEIFYYTLDYKTPATGEERIKQLVELRSIQDWVVKPRLLTVKGVAEINVIGGHEKQYHIMPDPLKMSRYGIHFSDIEEAIEKVNKNVGGGYVEQTAEQFLVQGVGLFKNIDDIRSVPVKVLESFKVISIDDIATVSLGRELRTGAALVNGNEAVVASVLMLMGENSRTVASRVSEQAKEIQKSLPDQVEIKALYDRADLVNATLGTVEHNLVTGATLVVVILLLLVGNARAAFITAATIPLSLLITFWVMNKMGISGNLMSLGALDFGIIVDGAVIVLDNCVRYVHEVAKKLGRKLTRDEIKSAVYEAAVEIRTAAGFGELIIVVVFLPLFALVGIEGKMFTPMAATFSIAVLGALVLSFTTAPALASLFLGSSVDEREPYLMRMTRKFYTPLLNKSILHRKKAIWIGLGSVVVGALLFSRLGGEFLPQLDEGSLTVQFVRPVNISLAQSIALQERTEVLLKEFGEVDTVFSRIGTAEVATDPMGVNLSDTYVMLKDHKQWPKVNGRIRTKEELSVEIIKKLENDIPGQRAMLSQPIQMRFNELLEGTRADISVKVFGEDMDKLAEITQKIAAVIQTVDGAGDVEVELKGKSPLLRVTPKPGILDSLGVSSREVSEGVGIAIGGDEVGFMYEGVRKVPILIRLSESARSDLNMLKQLPVGIGANTSVPLSEAATIGFTESYGSISREQAKRRAAVMINPRGRDTESFVDEAQKKVDAQVKMPAGYYVEWGGNFKNLQEARSRLMILTPLALGLVLMMIYTAFQSIAQTALIFACVPLALVGGVLGLVLNGLPFSISAGVGFIALSGIAVLNGVVLVNYFNDLRRHGKQGESLVREGALIRLRPVLMTALVDIFGFLPMMLSSGVGSEVQRPLASVVIGGILSSTLLTLVVLPALYLVFEKRMDIPKNAKSLGH